MQEYPFSKPEKSAIPGKILICFFAIFLFLQPTEKLACLPPEKIIHPGDWAYDAIYILSREKGIIFFADSRVTVGQMEKFLLEIDPETLSESGRVVYDQLTAYLESDYWLGFNTDAVSGGLDLMLQPEVYYKTNEDVPWIYDHHSRNSLILMPWGFSLGPWITAEMELNVGQNEYASYLHENYVNIPLDPVSQFDIHFPRRTYVSAGLPVGRASGFNFTIGLGDNFFGKTQTGSVIISEDLERIIYGQITIYSPAFKYTAQIMQYNVNKYHYMHFFQVRLFKKLSVSIAEGVMANAPLELRFMNPFAIFHSYESYKSYTDYNEDLGHQPNKGDDPWYKDYDRTYDPTGGSRIGSYLGIKIEFQPFKYFRIYGLMAMDQLQLGVEKKNWSESLTPNALAFQAGIDFSIPIKAAYLEFGLEGVYIYPYMYVLWDKAWSFYKDVPEVDNMTLRYWTGSPFGPDTIAGAFSAGFSSNGAFKTYDKYYAGLTFIFSARGERSEYTIFDVDNSIDDTYRPTNKVYDVTVPPTGTPVFGYTIQLTGEYYPTKYLSLSLRPGYRIHVNAYHIEGRIEHGFEMSFSLRFRPPVL